MINRIHDLPLARQAALLRLSRSSLYYEPQPGPEAALVIMRRIDALHLDYPFAGSRMLRNLLRGEGIVIGREKVRTMMRRMCIAALYRRPNTSKPRICCVAWRLSGRTRSGRGWPRFRRRSRWNSQTRAWTSRTFRWHGALSISQRSWTGSAGEFWPGGFRSPWRSISAWRRLRRRWPGTARQAHHFQF